MKVIVTVLMATCLVGCATPCGRHQARIDELSARVDVLEQKLDAMELTLKDLDVIKSLIGDKLNEPIVKEELIVE